MPTMPYKVGEPASLSNPIPIQIIASGVSLGGTGTGSSLAESLWTDNTNAFFVRIDSGAGIIWNNMSGVVVGAPGVGARPYSGTATGVALDASVLLGNASLATIATNSALQATSANQTTANTSLASILTKLGSVIINSSALPTGAATSANQPSQVTTSAGNAGRQVLVDPTSGVGAMVQAFHNADNQALGSTVYGVLTGGVDQLVNGSGNLDRKRGVSGDSMAVTGLAAEVPMIFNGASYDRLRSVAGDAASSTGIVQEAVALWNGATYDRWYGDKTNGAWVNVKALPALAAGSNIIGYAGSLNTQVVATPTITTSYASGACVGGLQTLSNFFRNAAQPSATLSQFFIGWTGAETVNLTAFIFSKAPGVSPTDGVAPSFTAADLRNLVTVPITTILAAPAAGSTKNFSATSLSLSVKNLESTLNLYVVLVADTAIATSANGDLFFSISGVLD